MPINSYSTGTVAIGAAATAVVGVGTLWTDVNARAGDTLIVDGHQVLIQDVTDATHLAIDAWPFTAVSAGASYKIVHNSPLRFAGAQAMVDVSALISALNTDGYIVVVLPTETVPNPSYGDENQYAFQWGTGKLWVKSGGIWTFVGTFKGFATQGVWSGATAYVTGDIVTLNGSSYLCVLGHTNHIPPNVTYWQLLASTPWALPPAAWVTATAYSATSPASVVTQGGATYLCIVAHTSGTFATDLAALKWLKISGADGNNGATGPVPWSVPVAWLTATAYVAGPPASVVVQGGESYVCLVSHTSGTFATDLAASRWIKITQKGSGDVLASNNGTEFTASTFASNLSLMRYAAQTLTSSQRSQARTNINAPLFGHLYGLTLTAAGGSVIFSIAAGEAADSTAVDLLILGSAYTKTTSAWAVGSGNGAWDGTGSNPGSNNIWQHVFIIKRPDTGVVDILISASPTAPTLPTNYTLFRRIGAMKTASGVGVWVKFFQLGDEFYLDAAVLDYSTTLGTSRTAVTVTSPLGIVCEVFYRTFFFGPSANAAVLFTDLTTNSTTPSFTVAPLASMHEATLGNGAVGTHRTYSNTSSQIGAQSNQASSTLRLATYGWRDTRGRLAA
jgi:hypothetical protein